MSGERIPAQCWPLGYFLGEEMKARGWTARAVANRIGGTPAERDVWELTVNLIVNCSDMDGIVITDSVAETLGLAFGLSPQFFINLHTSYQRWRARQPVAANAESEENSR